MSDQLSCILKLAGKYLLEGLGVGVATYLISGKKSTVMEIVMIGLSAALTFLFLDTFAPTIGSSARAGSGFGLGYQTVSGAVSPVMPLLVTQQQQQAVEGFANTGANAETDAQMNVEATMAMEEDVAEPAPVSEQIHEADAAIRGIYKAKCGHGLSHYNRNCQCTYTLCESCCKPGPECKVTCKKNDCVGCYKPDDIRDNNCAYKIIPGQYSANVVLPGYNECVKPYNQFD